MTTKRTSRSSDRSLVPRAVLVTIGKWGMVLTLLLMFVDALSTSASPPLFSLALYGFTGCLVLGISSYAFGIQPIGAIPKPANRLLLLLLWLPILSIPYLMVGWWWKLLWKPDWYIFAPWLLAGCWSLYQRLSGFSLNPLWPLNYQAIKEEIRTRFVRAMYVIQAADQQPASPGAPHAS